MLFGHLKWFDSVLNDQSTLLRGESHELVSVNRQPWEQSSPHKLFQELPNCFLLLNNSSNNRKISQGFILWIEKWKDKASPRWFTITLTDNSNTCLWVLIIQSHQSWAEKKFSLTIGRLQKWNAFWIYQNEEWKIEYACYLCAHFLF